VTLLAGLVIRSTVMLAAGLLLCALLSRRSAAVRHRVLAGSLAGAAAVGPLSLALPAWTVPVPTRLVAVTEVPLAPATSGIPAATAVSGSAATTPRPPGPLARQPEEILMSIWVAGVILSTGMLGAGLLGVARVSARASRVEDVRWLAPLQALQIRFAVTRPVKLLRGRSSDLLATWGWLRPQVLLPRQALDWTPERITVVLCHELAHIRRHDWLVQVCAESVRALLWFNPLAWIACTRLRRESELACDDEVLGAGVGGQDYAAQLLDLARQFRRRGPLWLSATPMAHSSTLERRIRAMLNPGLDRRLPTRRVMAAFAAVLLLVMIPLATVRAGQSGPAPLSGTIYDVTRAVLPGVRVTLVDANELSLEATSNAAGRFEFPPVGPGKYQMTINLPGFRTLRQPIELAEGRDWERAVTLQVGELQESVTIRSSRTASPPSPAVPSVIRVGGNVRAPKKIKDVKPIYPPSMQEAGLTGVVPVEALIGPDGVVSSVRVLSAAVHPDFAVAAVDAVRQWRFTPTLLNGQAVEVSMRVTVTFALE
jgi:TonB family protein